MAPLNFNAKVLAEPLLEFGDGGRDIDPRRGLVDYGPLQPMPGDKVRIGVIGTAETCDGFAQFIDRCRTGVDGKSQKLANLYPPFPGIGNLKSVSLHIRSGAGGPQDRTGARHRPNHRACEAVRGGQFGGGALL